MCIQLDDVNFRKEVLECRKPVVVEIGADWCGSCQIMAPILESLSKEYDGKIRIGRMNIDTNENLARRYGVNELPLFLFYIDGKIMDHFVGTVSKDQLQVKLNNLLTNHLKNGGVK